jgi:hypothetical protein
MAASKAPVFDPVIMPKTYESGNFKTCLDLIITSLSLSLHSLALCDLPVGAFFKTSMLHPGRLEHGPLEKFGFCGLIDGLFMFNKIFLFEDIPKKFFLKSLWIFFLYIVFRTKKD